jgi:hypothetical protein
MDDVPHLDWPIRVTGNTYASCQQDTNQEAAAAVAVLCCFERGSRVEAPNFGITDPTFGQQPVDVSEIERQASIYEPRAELDIRLGPVDQAGEQAVTIAVRIAASGDEDEEA